MEKLVYQCHSQTSFFPVGFMQGGKRDKSGEMNDERIKCTF